MKKLIWKIVLAASLLLMVVAAANIVLLSREYQKGINTYANLETDSIAANYAQAKLNQLCRRSTSLSLEMIIVPWLDVNQKIQYKPSDSDEVKTYITKSINGDLLSGTMSVSLIDFYATLDTE